jgi:hypothetical protein
VPSLLSPAVVLLEGFRTRARTTEGGPIWNKRSDLIMQRAGSGSDWVLEVPIRVKMELRARWWPLFQEQRPSWCLIPLIYLGRSDFLRFEVLAGIHPTTPQEPHAPPSSGRWLCVALLAPSRPAAAVAASPSESETAASTRCARPEARVFEKVVQQWLRVSAPGDVSNRSEGGRWRISMLGRSARRREAGVGPEDLATAVRNAGGNEDQALDSKVRSSSVANRVDVHRTCLGGGEAP